MLGLCLPNVLSLIGASDPLPKVLAAVPLAYFVSPIQLIPSFIPVLGQLDDIGSSSLACGWRRASLATVGARKTGSRTFRADRR